MAKNLASSLIVGPAPSTTGVTLYVTSSTGSNFDTAPFYATLFKPDTVPTVSNSEIVQVTNVSGDTLTIVRAQRGTTAKDIATGWRIIAGFYKEDLDALNAHVASTSNPHSVTKAQVGLGNVDNTSDSNKPISSATQTALNAKLANITALIQAGSNVSISGTGTSADPYVISSSSILGLNNTFTGYNRFNNGIIIPANDGSGVLWLVSVNPDGSLLTNIYSPDLPVDSFITEDGLFYFVTEDGINYIAQE